MRPLNLTSPLPCPRRAVGRSLAESDAPRCEHGLGPARMTAWGKPLSGRGHPFRLDSFLAVLGRAPAFWLAFSESSAGFAESRPETTSSKARR